MKNRLGIFKKNKATMVLICVYLVIIAGISYAVCYFSYEQRQGELLAELDRQLVRAAAEYESITENFWSIYIPVFTDGGEGQRTLRSYYTVRDDAELTPLEKFALKEMLLQMATRDNRVQWIALYTDARTINYIYYSGQNSLQPMSEDFPYLQELQEKKDVMEIYGQKYKATPYGENCCVAIAGGVPEGAGNGSLLVGYDISVLQQICSGNQSFASLQFDVAIEGRSLFSSGESAYLPGQALEIGSSGIFPSDDGRRYVQVSDQGRNGTRIYYSVKWGELFRLSHHNTPLVLLVVVVLVIISFGVYGGILQMLAREVELIRTGLQRIGKRELDYRIEGNFNQSGFQEIAEAINDMTQSLKENIDRAYEYELRQKEAEMQELQAKFNPHFLYNSLEMFRARCYQNGDEETAELIAQTAAIFRGFIGVRTFVPLQEELAFGRRYLELFHARYGENVQILYDIDTEVLGYGIIRNVFQPLIENYFEHGIDPTREDNYIRFQGKIRDEETILITVDDNGAGMEPEKMEQFNRSLKEPIATENESYGLKNLHQRLRLFYGEPCGITLRSRQGGGFMVEMIIRRMYYEKQEVEK